MSKPLSPEERAVALRVFASNRGQEAVRPDEKAMIIGEVDFWRFMADWTQLVTLACEEAINRKLREAVYEV
jgi:hypothetical protein